MTDTTKYDDTQSFETSSDSGDVAIAAPTARATATAPDPDAEATARVWFDATGDAFTTALRASQTCECCDPDPGTDGAAGEVGR